MGSEPNIIVSDADEIAFDNVGGAGTVCVVLCSASRAAFSSVAMVVVCVVILADHAIWYTF